LGDALLTFCSKQAGLFSAVLTAFLIESYQKLHPDSGDETVALLTQLLQLQLQATGASNNSFVPPPPDSPATPFQPLTSMVACNILWFLSLAFSLGCALGATLVQGWIRFYLQDTQHTSPKKRARMRTFLHEGINNYQMDAIVGTIPTLLHISLFFFYCGVITFFWSWNKTISILHISVLGFFTAVYTFITLLPLFSLSCPFSTPFSGFSWWTVQSICRYLPLPREPESHLARFSKSYSDTRYAAAAESTPERGKREEEAVSWLLETCADESEFEEFVELIPHVIEDNSPGNTLRGIIYSLLLSSRVQLAPRISDLLKTCTTALDANQRARRIDTCSTAVYSAVSFDGGRILSAPGCLHVDTHPSEETFDSGPWSWWTWCHRPMSVSSSNPTLDLSLFILLMSRTLLTLDSNIPQLRHPEYPKEDKPFDEQLMSLLLVNPMLRLARLCDRFLQHHNSNLWRTIFAPIALNDNEVHFGPIRILSGGEYRRTLERRPDDSDWGWAASLDDVSVFQCFISLIHKRVFVLMVLEWFHWATTSRPTRDIVIDPLLLGQTLGVMLNDELPSQPHDSPHLRHLAHTIVSIYNDNIATSGVSIDFKRIDDKLNEWSSATVWGWDRDLPWFTRTTIQAICAQAQQDSSGRELVAQSGTDATISGAHKEQSSLS
jgi:hypothetical protein